LLRALYVVRNRLLRSYVSERDGSDTSIKHRIVAGWESPLRGVLAGLPTCDACGAL